MEGIMADYTNEVLDWESEISDESGFILLPEGDYRYTVTGFERGNFEGSANLPPCHKAIVTFKIHAPEGDVEIKDNFMLCKKLEWKLSSLFLSVGLKKHDEPLRMNWQALMGRQGYCHVYIDTYEKKDKSQGQSNKIQKLYAYDDDVKALRSATPTGYNAAQAGYPAGYNAAYIPSSPVQPAAGGWKPGTF